MNQAIKIIEEYLALIGYDTTLCSFRYLCLVSPLCYWTSGSLTYTWDLLIYIERLELCSVTSQLLFSSSLLSTSPDSTTSESPVTMKLTLFSLLSLLSLACWAVADPTWPSDIDELEEIMYQLTSFRARKFADTVSPCGNEASGPGRQNAAEWLRTAFHDMSTANSFFGTGGLDASLQYELTNGENTGPGHKTTLEFMSAFMSKKSSLSDLIALGVYTSVRSCGGPSVPVRAGRKDATTKGNTGVPQIQNSVFTFQQQFNRMGFSNQEMIQVTACGHTLGGVHRPEFPALVPSDARDGEAGMDSSVAAFDNRVVTEYLSGNTRNPLVVGPSVKLGKNSDFKVFNSDGNQTMEGMANPNTFKNVCKAVLQKMIDVVPSGVQLTDVIAPYMVKPVNLQLTLQNGGVYLLLTGFIRVRTTEKPASSIKSLTITYKDRNGGSSCGSGSCSFTITVQGIGKGFDETFAFFPISTQIPVSSGISSFVVTVNNADNTKTNYNNNGKGYPIQDAVILQLPQSCLKGSNGALTITAAVRNDRLDKGAQATISYKAAQPGSPVPALKEETITLNKAECVGSYTFFRREYTIRGGKAYESRIDVTNGDKADSFKAASDIGGSCRNFSNAPSCVGGSVASSTSTKSKPPAKKATPPPTNTPRRPPASKPPAPKTRRSTTSESAKPGHLRTVSPFTLVGCWSEAKSGKALSKKKTSSKKMTNKMCAKFCKGYKYFGTENRSECYCGSALSSSSQSAPLDECNTPCAGDATSSCGAKNRLELYMNTKAITARAEQPAAAGKFIWQGCRTEISGRALREYHMAVDNMTNDMCAEFCKDFEYFGTEYGTECYCGKKIRKGSKGVEAGECDMVCGGGKEFCGGHDRISVYEKRKAFKCKA